MSADPRGVVDGGNPTGALAADGLSRDAVKVPPLETSFLFCETCGRDDRFIAFSGSGIHYSGGSKCPALPIRVVYEFVKADRG